MDLHYIYSQNKILVDKICHLSLDRGYINKNHLFLTFNCLQYLLVIRIYNLFKK